MSNGERIFVTAVKKYCASHGIAVELKADGWLIAMTRGSQRRFTFGYDLGLNSAVAHRIANDKARHRMCSRFAASPAFRTPRFSVLRCTSSSCPSGAWTEMLDLLKQNPQGIVVKPNEGTGGMLVFKVRSEPELEVAAHEIFSSEKSLAISPYVEIEDEIRVILIDYRPIVVISKSRLSVTGDGKRSVLELAIATIPAGRLSAVLSGLAGDISKAALDDIPSAGRRQALNWRHNLGAGAQAVVLDQGEPRAAACVEIAIEQRDRSKCASVRSMSSSGRRRLESAGNQLGRHDGSAEPVSPGTGRCGLWCGTGPDLRSKDENLKAKA